jgi:ABC-2 type transport system ATP-binding protein
VTSTAPAEVPPVPPLRSAPPVIEVEKLGIRFNRKHGKKKRRIKDVLTGHSVVRPSMKDFWALRDVSFTVEPGEAVGLVGANGHGKSTLLKLMAGVLLPDEGTVAVRGGVAPLIEITGGFVGELTARDNIWLTAGLHGLSKKEIQDRFDEIVDFSEVGEFLDTPFRHFSSGMKVRLGFAVITSLDEPIVLVDEVLAVGDRAFREKCYVRMENLLSGGRTLFLVTHSEPSLRRFCTRGLYLKTGRLITDGTVDEAIDQYNDDNNRGREE